ncbi:trypsin-like serine protease [Streptomyces sp. NPDC055808]
MRFKRSRRPWSTGLLALGAETGFVAILSASAVTGGEVKDGHHAFAAKLNIGDQASCSCALVDQQWVLTAASCFAARRQARPDRCATRENDRDSRPHRPQHDRRHRYRRGLRHPAPRPRPRHGRVSDRLGSPQRAYEVLAITDGFREQSQELARDCGSSEVTRQEIHASPCRCRSNPTAENSSSPTLTNTPNCRSA